MRHNAAALLLVVVLPAVAVSARQLQTQVAAPRGGAVSFEAASIKPNMQGAAAGGGANFRAGGRFVARNATPRLLMAVAYGDPCPLSASQLAGGPAWLDADRYDVEAKAAGEFTEGKADGGCPASGGAMLRALLADRFRLVAHIEKREISVYALVRRSDSRPGTRLTASSGADCASDPGIGQPAGPSPDPRPRCGSYVLSNAGGMQFAIHARAITMAALAKNIQNVAGRVVLDRTGLNGTFSFDLDFELRPASVAPAADDGMGPAIFTAVQEQLGLKLDATTGPADVVVVDRVERPGPD